MLSTYNINYTTSTFPLIFTLKTIMTKDGDFDNKLLKR